jgi:hypothetical protein
MGSGRALDEVIVDHEAEAIEHKRINTTFIGWQVNSQRRQIVSNWIPAEEEPDCEQII